jgi:peptidoglycan/xylan/chitin deacetylase (PgdA/CDA1 family)
MPPIPVLVYHSISDDPPSWIAPFTIRTRDYTAHLDAMADAGYTSLTVSRLVSDLAAGVALPARPVVITFDDGFADLLSVAAPHLAKRGMTATAYLTTEALGAENRSLLPPAEMIDLGQARDVEAHGLEIGTHTLTHPELDTVPLDRARREIAEPKKILEDVLGHRVDSFAYPHGYNSTAVRRLVDEAGYLSACAVRNALSSPGDDRFQIARLTLMSTTTHTQVTDWLNGSGARVAPFPERLVTKGWRAYRRHFRRKP